MDVIVYNEMVSLKKEVGELHKKIDLILNVLEENADRGNTNIEKCKRSEEENK